MMRNLPHLAARLYNVPLMLLPDTAEVFASVFESAMAGRYALALPAPLGGEPRPAKPEGFASNVPVPARFADKPYAVTEGGVGVLPVYGALVQRAGAIDANCMPMASYQRLQRQMARMQADADVKAILLELDSPGGEVAGNFELARTWAAARESAKPVWAHANEGAYSAAYSLAASASRLVVPQAGSVGSIGVVMMHVDQSAKDAKQGLVYTPIYAGARKTDFSSHAPLSAAAREAGQAEVNRLYDMFVGHVASARGLDAQAVRATEAGVLAANDARAAGLVDAVGSFEDTLAELEALVRQRTSGGHATSFSTGGRAAHADVKGGTPMSQSTTAASNPAAAQTDPSAQALAEAREAGRKQGHTEGQAQGEAEGRQAGAAGERTRIGAILRGDAAKGRTALAMTLAMDTDMPAEQAALVLAAAAQEAPATPAAAASPLAAAMAQVPNPKVGPQAEASSEDDTDQALAKNVVALHRSFTKGA